MTFGRDRGLVFRIGLTLALLGALYVVALVAVRAAGAGVTLTVIVLGGLALAQLFLSEPLAVRGLGAREVSALEAPELHGMIERLCAQADLPKPRIAIAPTAAPSAFAIGRPGRRAVVGATTGLIELLDPHELEAVLAHELAHVRDRDVALLTVASFFAGVAAMLARFGWRIGGGAGEVGQDGVRPIAALVVTVALACHLPSYGLMVALSRHRELVADRDAAMTTRRPAALGSALLKLSAGMDAVPAADLRLAGELNAFLIVPARAKGTVVTMLPTHPPLAQRIAALERLERDRAT